MSNEVSDKRKRLGVVLYTICLAASIVLAIIFAFAGQWIGFVLACIVAIGLAWLIAMTVIRLRTNQP